MHLMSYLIVGAVAFAVALLTFFSGFGLGSLLLPAFSFFFPLEIAVAATAVVHLANNLFKFVLMGRYTHWKTAALFGVPAACASFLGAQALILLANFEPLHHYMFFEKECVITPIGLVIGILIICFSAFDLRPLSEPANIPSKFIPAGGLLSGFFGGLSGHQGAFRAAFLIKAGLRRDAFIATGVVCAIAVDIVRLSVYGTHRLEAVWNSNPAKEGEPAIGMLVAVAAGCAFAGSYGGSRLISKVTLGFVQKVVGVMLLVLGTAIATGWV
jgi:uncharacterized membrane protein YfcA